MYPTYTHTYMYIYVYIWRYDYVQVDLRLGQGCHDVRLMRGCLGCTTTAAGMHGHVSDDA